MSGQTSQRSFCRNGSPSSGSASTSPASSASSSAKQPRSRAIPVTFIRGNNNNNGGMHSPTRNNSNNKLFSPAESPVSNWNVNVIGGFRSKSQISPTESKSPIGGGNGNVSGGNLKDWQGTHKEKCRTPTAKSAASPIIRRTASLDTIYLTGQWPRDYLHTYCGRPLVDESTQTPDEWEESSEKRSFPRPINQSNTDDQLDKIRQRLQKSKESSRQTFASGQHHSPIHGDHFAISSLASTCNSALAPQASSSSFYTFPHPSPQGASRVISIPRANVQKTIVPRMRNSVEGLNQEIEKLVLKGISGNEEWIDRAVYEPTPDGHRAPVADILRQTRNANTQTPSGASAIEVAMGSSGCGTSSNSPISCCPSLSPGHSGVAEAGFGSRPSSQNDGEILNCKATPYGKDDSKSASPEPSDVQLGTSPCINKFLAREPPDGCERVKIIEEYRAPQQVVFDPMAYFRPKPTNSAFKPSSSSAFYPPFKGFQSMATPDLAVIAATHPAQNPSAIEG